MALDNLEGIREWRDRLVELDPGTVVGLKSETLSDLMGLLFEEIDRLQSVVDSGKENRLESVVSITSLRQRRKVVKDTPVEVPLD